MKRKLSPEELDKILSRRPLEQALARRHFCRYLDVNGPRPCPFEEGYFFCNRPDSLECSGKPFYGDYEENEGDVELEL